MVIGVLVRDNVWILTYGEASESCTAKHSLLNGRNVEVRLKGLWLVFAEFPCLSEVTCRLRILVIFLGN